MGSQLVKCISSKDSTFTLDMNKIKLNSKEIFTIKDKTKIKGIRNLYLLGIEKFSPRSFIIWPLFDHSKLYQIHFANLNFSRRGLSFLKKILPNLKSLKSILCTQLSSRKIIDDVFYYVPAMLKMNLNMIIINITSGLVREVDAFLYGKYLSSNKMSENGDFKLLVYTNPKYENSSSNILWRAFEISKRTIKHKKQVRRFVANNQPKNEIVSLIIDDEQIYKKFAINGKLPETDDTFLSGRQEHEFN